MAISRQKGICLEIMESGEIEGIGCEYQNGVIMTQMTPRIAWRRPLGKGIAFALVYQYTTGFHTDVWWKGHGLEVGEPSNLAALLFE